MATTNPLTRPLEAAKAYIALLGTVATALLAVYGPDTAVGHWLTVISIVATAVATFVVPNAQARSAVDEDEAEFGDDVYIDGHGA